MPEQRERNGKLVAFVIAWFSLTFIAFFFDMPVENWFSHGAGEKIFHPLLTFVDYMGQYPIHMLVIAILVSCFKSRRMIYEYTVLMLVSMILCTILKYSIGRARPRLGLGHFYFSPLTFNHAGMNAFPSGDAPASMALAMLLGIYFPRGRWFFLLLGIWASLGRVAAESHYLSDVVFGGGLGVLCVIVGHALLTRAFGNEVSAGKTQVTGKGPAIIDSFR